MNTAIVNIEKKVGLLMLLVVGTLSAFSQSALKSIAVNYAELQGLDRDPNGFLRRDNSDIIQVDGLYYVWYSKMRQFVPDLPVVSTIWYATSPDGYTWTEKGECIKTGDTGSWDDLYAYTPGILVAEGKYYLFYTAISSAASDNELPQPNTAIGMAVADSPNGPWTKLPSNPVLIPSADRSEFDSHRVDDSCLIIRDGKYWLYYKGRQWGKSPAETKMGVAIAKKPEGPYVRHEANPLVGGNHEVLVWPQGEGVGAMIGMKLKGRQSIPFYLMYAEDGIHFKKTYEISNQNAPWAPGAYRPEAFTGSGQGEMIRWGLHIGGERPDLYLERFELVKQSTK
ncbi:MAG: family 43 glycosylhydrolase [Cyclobacteriaceae bacterium]